MLRNTVEKKVQFNYDYYLLYCPVYYIFVNFRDIFAVDKFIHHNDHAEYETSKKVAGEKMFGD